MSAKELPARANVDQYKKQAKELLNAYTTDDRAAVERVRAQSSLSRISLADAQFVIASEHGFDSWPKFAKHVAFRQIARAVESLDDPVASFVDAACVPRDGRGHTSGSLVLDGTPQAGLRERSARYRRFGGGYRVSMWLR